MRAVFISVLLAATALGVASQTSHSICTNNTKLNWCDFSLSYEKRAELIASEIISNITDVAAQLSTFTPSLGPPIERLSLPTFQWHSEGLHGLRNSFGTVGHNATLFPQVTGMVSTGNPEIIVSMAAVMATEARALNNIAQSHNPPLLFGKGAGLSFWSPTLNIPHDVRWGRSQESLGSEGPYLAGLLSATFVKTFQGPQANDPDRGLLNLAATCKHFLGYSLEGLSPQANITRHTFNAVISRGDLNASYLPIFHACVTQGNPSQVMCSYNALTILDKYGDSYNKSDAIPACLHQDTLTGTLRSKWGWGLTNGFVVSDQGAIKDAYVGHNFSSGPVAASASGVTAGCDQNDGRIYNDNLAQGLQEGLVDLKTLNESLKRILTVEFRTGLYDPPSSVPWVTIPPSAIDSEAHRTAALTAARESLVLATNNADTLPLKPEAAKKLVVVGQFANYPMSQMGGKTDYHPSFVVSHLDGIVSFLNDPQVAKRVASGQSLAGLDIGLLPGRSLGNDYNPAHQGFRPTAGAMEGTDATFATASGPTVHYVQGCNVTSCYDGGTDSAAAAASDADIVVAVVGIDKTIEGEGVDRTFIGVPSPQVDLLKAVKAAMPSSCKLVVVLAHGGSLSPDWSVANADAIIDAFEGGQSGGQALAEVLFGAFNPSGMEPYTVYPSKVVDEVSMYNMSFLAGPGRTYRYYKDTPIFAFGHGLSYTTFTFEWSTLPPQSAPITAAGAITASVKVTNTGAVAGGAPVLAFSSLRSASDGADPSPYTPLRQMYGISKVFLQPGQSKVVSFSTASALSVGTRGLNPALAAVPDYTSESQDEPTVAAAVHDMSKGWCTLCDVSETGERRIRAGRYELSIGSDGAGNGGVTATVQLDPLSDGTSSFEVPLM
jgi:beta-glucosidase-like glycosyl hydrolase